MSVFDWLNKAEQGAAAAPDAPPSAQELEERVVTALRTVFDPEIPVNIYDLGLIYGINVDAPTGKVHVDMTLTAPGCPVAQTFPDTVKNAVEMADGVNEATVELVWEPPWTRDRMSEAAQLELGML
jgi:FeS assembly SUF system protein